MKQKVCFLFVLICLFTIQATLFAVNTPVSFGDSLRQTVSHAEGMERINLWQQIVVGYSVNGELDKMRAAITLMHEDAEATGDPAVVSRPMIQLLAYYYNQHYTDSFELVVPAYLEHFEKNNQLDLYFRAFELRVVLSATINEKDVQETDLIQEMYEKARQLNYPEGIGTALKHMGNRYITMERYTEAEESFREALSVLGKSTQPGICNEVYMLYVNMLLNAKRYDDSLELLKKQEPYLQQTDSIYTAKGIPGAATAFYFYMYRGFFNTYFNLENVPMARHYLELMKASPIARGGGMYILIELQSATLDLYTLEGRYAEAVTISDSLLTWYKQMNEPAGIHNQLARQRNLYLRMGNAEKLNETFKELQAHNDSIMSLEQNAKIDELRTIYEVDKIKLEKEKQRIYTLAATGGCLLLFVILILTVVYTRKLKQKNLSLYRQIQERLRAEEEVEKSILAPATDQPLTREAELFRSLTELMQKERLFVQQDIDRKTLAEVLGTNEKYVANAIRQGTGETVLAYISRLRLQYALQLFDKHPDYSLEAVAEESGHSSYSTFYRTFTKFYGMSPSEYKRLALKPL